MPTASRGDKTMFLPALRGDNLFIILAILRSYGPEELIPETVYLLTFFLPPRLSFKMFDFGKEHLDSVAFLWIVEASPTIAETVECAVPLKPSEPNNIKETETDELPNRPGKKQTGHCALNFSKGKAKVRAIETRELFIKTEENPY